MLQARLYKPLPAPSKFDEIARRAFRRSQTASAQSLLTHRPSRPLPQLAAEHATSLCHRRYSPRPHTRGALSAVRERRRLALLAAQSLVCANLADRAMPALYTAEVAWDCVLRDNDTRYAAATSTSTLLEGWSSRPSLARRAPTSPSSRSRLGPSSATCSGGRTSGGRTTRRCWASCRWPRCGG